MGCIKIKESFLKEGRITMNNKCEYTRSILPDLLEKKPTEKEIEEDEKLKKEIEKMKDTERKKRKHEKENNLRKRRRIGIEEIEKIETRLEEDREEIDEELEPPGRRKIFQEAGRRDKHQT